MKKTITALVLLSFLAVLVMPMVVSAQAGALAGCTMKRDVGMGDACPGLDGECLYTNTDFDCGTCCLLNTIYGVVDWIFIILVAVVALFVIIGGMTIIMAGGDPEKVKSGRNYIMYAVIGLVVAFLARAVPAIVRMAVGGF